MIGKFFNMGLSLEDAQNVVNQNNKAKDERFLEWADEFEFVVCPVVAYRDLMLPMKVKERFEGLSIEDKGLVYDEVVKVFGELYGGSIDDVIKGMNEIIDKIVKK